MYCLVYGITSGTYILLLSVVIIDLIGIKSYVEAFGIQLFFSGIGRLIGPPIVGKYSEIICTLFYIYLNNFIQVHFMNQLEIMMQGFTQLALYS